MEQHNFPEENISREQTQEQEIMVYSGKRFSHTRFAYLSLVAIFLGFQILGIFFGSIARSQGWESAWIQGLAQILGMLIPAILLTKYSPLGTAQLLRAEKDVSVRQWCWGLSGILAVHLTLAGITRLQDTILPEVILNYFQTLSSNVDSLYERLLRANSILGFLQSCFVGAVIPAFSEEILFRGVVQRSLEAEKTVPKALIITSILFGLIHFHPEHFLGLVLLGGYFGAVAWLTESLAVSIVLHFVNNLLAIIALQSRSISSTSSNELTLGAAWFFFGAGIILLSFVCGGLYIQKLKNS